MCKFSISTRTRLCDWFTTPDLNLGNNFTSESTLKSAFFNSIRVLGVERKPLKYAPALHLTWLSSPTQRPLNYGPLDLTTCKSYPWHPNMSLAIGPYDIPKPQSCTSSLHHSTSSIWTGSSQLLAKFPKENRCWYPYCYRDERQ